MPHRIFIVHLSDTHYATSGQALMARVINWNHVPSGGLADGLVRRVRKVIVDSDGCEPADPQLRQQMLDLLVTLRPLKNEPNSSAVLVHSGDLTQAGQIASLEEEIREITVAFQGDIFAIPGNHDLWPDDFPLFGSAETYVHRREISTVSQLITEFPHFIDVGANHELRLWFFDSTISDSWLNTFALGHIGDTCEKGSRRNQFNTLGDRRSQLPPARVQIAVVHHPVCPYYRSSARTLFETVFGTGYCNLIDRDKVANELVHHGFSIVLCGHDHMLPSPNNVIWSNGEILHLPVVAATQSE